MAVSKEPLQISESDLYSSKVDAFVEQQEFLRRAAPDITEQPIVVKIIYSSWFYLAIAAGLGGFVAWCILEPFLDFTEGRASVAVYLLFPTVAGFVGLFLGGVEGLMCRNFARAMISSAVGLGIGFVGGLITIFAAGFVFIFAIKIANEISEIRPGEMPKGMALVVFMMGRGLAWTIASIPAGLGQGIALREKKIILNGLLGAVFGGLIGGLLFDPIDIACQHFFHSDPSASISRAVGFTVIGIMVGLFVGLVEQWTKTAWLFMKAGPLAGKQFVLFRNPTVIGSSPKADIYLFKDDAIEPRHALIHNRGGRFEIEDCNSADGTYVNNIPIRRQFLNPGDQIVIGKTVLAFSLRESK